MATASSPRCVQQLQPIPQLNDENSDPGLSRSTSLTLSSASSPTTTTTTTVTTGKAKSARPPPATDQDLTIHVSKQHPDWLRVLLSTKFYGRCERHATLRKNDLNLFCTTHALKICQYCQSDSKSSNHSKSKHNKNKSTCCSERCTILHVSRYMYHDVLLAREASAVLEMGFVQSYVNNGNKVVYMDRRAQPRSKVAPNAKACLVCDRTLQEGYRFCSILCRLGHDGHPVAGDNSVPVPDGGPLLGGPGGRRVGGVEKDKEDKEKDREGEKDREKETGKRVGGQVGCDMVDMACMGLNMGKRRRKSMPVRSLLAAGNGLVMTL